MESAGIIYNKVRLFEGPGKRRYPRFSISKIHVIRKVGCEEDFKIKAINISRGGALLCTKRRLDPGMHIQLNIVIARKIKSFIGCVLRTNLTSTKWRSRYQVAVAFDRPLRIFREYPEPITDLSQACHDAFPQLGTSASETDRLFSGPAEEKDSDMIDAFLKIQIFCEQDETLQEMFRLNDW